MKDLSAIKLHQSKTPTSKTSWQTGTVTLDDSINTEKFLPKSMEKFQFEFNQEQSIHPHMKWVRKHNA